MSFMTYEINIVMFISFSILVFQMMIMSQIGTRIWLYTLRDDHFYIFPDIEDHKVEQTVM